MKWIKRAAVLIALIAVGVFFYIKAQLAGWTVNKLAPTMLAQVVEPHLQVFKPEGDGPFKTILLFHGCGGDRAQQEHWGKIFQNWGYAAVLVDSYQGRNIDFDQALEQVCKGKQLLGSERAGDVLIALAWAKQQAWFNHEDVVLAGWSHGAWSVMDAFALHSQDTLPHNLESAPEALISDAQKVILFYPYCGLASKTNKQGWSSSVSMLAFDVEQDTVVGSQSCDDAYEAIRASGNKVQHEVFKGVDHAFDVDAIVNIENWEYRTSRKEGLEAAEKAKKIIQTFLQ